MTIGGDAGGGGIGGPVNVSNSAIDHQLWRSCGRRPGAIASAAAAGKVARRSRSMPAASFRLRRSRSAAEAAAVARQAMFPSPTRARSRPMARMPRRQ